MEKYHNCITSNTEYKPHKQIALYIQRNQQMQKDTDKAEKEQGQASSINFEIMLMFLP